MASSHVQALPLVSWRELTEQTLIEKSKEKGGHLVVSVGEAVPERGYYTLSIVYIDRADKTKKAITLDLDPEAWEDLELIAHEGQEWYNDEEAQEESNRLQQPAFDRMMKTKSKRRTKSTVN